MLRRIWLLVAILSLAACESNAQLTPTPSSTPAVPPTSPPSTQMGILTGRVTIGPLRPVERVGETPPPVPPEVYAARSINIFATDGATLVVNVKINPNGTYNVNLPPGVYVVNIARTGIDRGRNLPKTITIESGKTVQLDIDIDTGIR